MKEKDHRDVSDFPRGLPAPAVSQFPFLRGLDYCHCPSCISHGSSCLEGSLYPSWTCLLPACPGCSCLVLAVSSVTLSILFPDSQWQQANLICVLSTSRIGLWVRTKEQPSSLA